MEDMVEMENEGMETEVVLEGGDETVEYDWDELAPANGWDELAPLPDLVVSQTEDDMEDTVGNPISLISETQPIPVEVEVQCARSDSTTSGFDSDKVSKMNVLFRELKSRPSLRIFPSTPSSSMNASKGSATIIKPVATEWTLNNL